MVLRQLGVLAWAAVTAGVLAGPVLAAGEDIQWAARMRDAKEAYQAGDFAKAEVEIAAAVKVAESFGPQDDRLAQALGRQVMTYTVQEKYAAAEAPAKRAVETAEKINGPEHLNVARVLNDLAGICRSQGKLAEAEPLYRRALAIAEKTPAGAAATVGMVLRAISERAGFLGRLAVGLVGMAWTLATYLAVPVLVTKDVGPLDAVKESAALFKRTWGEQVVGNFGMGWVVVLAGLSWCIVSVLLMVLGAQISPWGVAAGAVVAVAGFVFLALLASALKGVYTAALYRYASTGEAGYFEPAMVENAFRPKR
jgi:tetratricopeptide (TPR) repeat protein